MSQPAKKYSTPEEYLALEEKAAYKSEYYRGEILAMAGDSAQHSQISVNVSTALNLKLRAWPCTVFNSDMKVLVRADNFYTYPDVSVVCGEIQYGLDKDGEVRSDIITNPVILVEVMSPGTKDYDRGGKFELYRALSTFRHYLLVDSERVYVEYHRHTLTGWLMQSYIAPDASFNLNLNGKRLRLALADFYKKVRLD